MAGKKHATTTTLTRLLVLLVVSSTLLHTQSSGQSKIIMSEQLTKKQWKVCRLNGIPYVLMHSLCLMPLCLALRH